MQRDFSAHRAPCSCKCVEERAQDPVRLEMHRATHDKAGKFHTPEHARVAKELSASGLQELDKSADYPYGTPVKKPSRAQAATEAIAPLPGRSYFLGKKRLWETRVQCMAQKTET